MWYPVFSLYFYSSAHLELHKTFLHVLFVAISRGGREGLRVWTSSITEDCQNVTGSQQVYTAFIQSLYSQHGLCGFVYSKLAACFLFFLLEVYWKVELWTSNFKTWVTKKSSQEESLCCSGLLGSWGKEGSREGKNRAKESSCSSRLNAVILKAKYSPGQRINQLDTDMYLKGKHTFSILQRITVQALVCK